MSSPTAEPVSLPPAKGFALIGGLIALAIAAGATVVAGVFLGDRSAADPRRLVFSYLTGLMFVTSVSVGALAWVMLHHLTGAVWSVVIRRLLENLTRLLPWIAILFIPVALNLNRLYPWADPSRVAADPGLAQDGLAQPAFFQRPVSRLSRLLGGGRGLAGAELRPPGPKRRSGRGSSDAGDQRVGPDRAGVDHQLRRVRLVDVARSKLVFDDLRGLLLGGLAGRFARRPGLARGSDSAPPVGSGRRSASSTCTTWGSCSSAS